LLEFINVVTDMNHYHHRFHSNHTATVQAKTLSTHKTFITTT